jgi:hypothetical protein
MKILIRIIGLALKHRWRLRAICRDDRRHLCLPIAAQAIWQRYR